MRAALVQHGAAVARDAEIVQQREPEPLPVEARVVARRPPGVVSGIIVVIRPV